MSFNRTSYVLWTKTTVGDVKRFAEGPPTYFPLSRTNAVEEVASSCVSSAKMERVGAK